MKSKDEKSEPIEVTEAVEATSTQRINIKEFFAGYKTELTNPQRAAIASLAGGKSWMTLAEWESLYTGYIK